MIEYPLVGGAAPLAGSACLSGTIRAVNKQVEHAENLIQAHVSAAPQRLECVAAVEGEVLTSGVQEGDEG